MPICFGLALWALIDLNFDYFTAIPGQTLAQTFNRYLLENIFRSLQLNSFSEIWSPTFFYPIPNLFSFNNIFFGSSFFYIIYRFFGFSSEHAFLFWILCGHVLNLLSSYFVFRKLGFSQIGSTIGALTFSFSLPEFTEADQASVLYRFACPLAWYYLFLFLSLKKIQHLTLFVLFMSWLAYCSLPLCLIFLFFLALFTALFFLTKSPLFLPTLGKSQFNSNATIALNIFVICILLFILWLFFKKISVSHAQLNQLIVYPEQSLDLTYQLFWWGNDYFLGLGTWALVLNAGVCIVKRQLPSYQLSIAINFILAGMALLISAMPIDGFSLLAWFIKSIPLFRLYSFHYIIYILLLPIAVLIAISADYFLRPFDNSEFKQSCLGVLLILMVYFYPITHPAAAVQTSIEESRKRQADILSILPKTVPDNSILYLDPHNQPNPPLSSADAMVLAQSIGLPSLNGYLQLSPQSMLPQSKCQLPQALLHLYRKLASTVEPSPSPLGPLSRLKGELITILPSQIDPQLFQVKLTNGALVFNQQENYRLLRCGWSTLEKWGVWANGNAAEMIIPLPPNKKMGQVFELNFDAFITNHATTQNFNLYINFVMRESIKANQRSHNRITLKLNEQDLKLPYLLVHFEFYNPVSPASLNLGNDSRKLSIGITSASIH
jgi:hypothetical protein